MKNKMQNKVIFGSIMSCFIVVILLLLSVWGYVIWRGANSFDGSLFGVGMGSYSVFPAMFNTLVLVMGTLVFAFPIAVFTAMFLWFYEHHIPKIVLIIQALIDSLGAVPSIVYALFGLILFVGQMKLGFSLISGIFTMKIVILPVLIRSAEQSLQGIPTEVYLSGISLGVSKTSVMFFVLLPQAYRGIISGGILAIGRVVGESAALIFTMGTAGGMIYSPFDSGRTLAVQVYSLANEGLYIEYAYATAAVLLLFAIVLNVFSVRLLKK